MTEHADHHIELAPYCPERDLGLLSVWLRQPHVSRWWGDPEAALLEVSAPPVVGGEALIAVDGLPVGYLRWQVPDRDHLDAAGLSEIPDDAIDLDIAIGEAGWLGRGIGPRALALLLDRLALEGVSTVMLATSAENASAVRAYEKAGFIRSRQFVDTDGDICWLMLFTMLRG